ncbi:diphthamide biosynthesis enzyme Dph2 [Nanoarchaeota archaeon]
MTFDFELEKLVSELKKIKPKKVLVQLPEGIKQDAFKVSKVIEDLGIKVIVSGQTCWGGCSIAVNEAQQVGADLIVHFGHAKFIDVDFPVLYIEMPDNLDLTSLLQRSLEQLGKFERIGLAYSIQHKHDIGKIVKFYQDNGKKVILTEKKGHVAYEGHVVGCQYSGFKSIQDKIDCFVVIGNNFHSMGAAISVEKPVFLIDVYNDKITEMKNVREMIIKQRMISIEKLKQAKKVGIIRELKLGQVFGDYDAFAEKLKKQGKEVVMISMEELTPDKIMNFYNVDCFVVFACPRIAIDDFAKYEKPILTPREALVAIGEKSWDEFLESGVI